MNKLFSILLSFYLIVAPVTVAAQTGGATAGANHGGYNIPGTSEVSSPAEDKYLKSGTGSDGGYDFWTKQVLVLATSTIGTNIATQCYKALTIPSLGLFMTGSLAHIVSELVGAKSKNSRHKKKLADLELKKEDFKKTGDVSQKEILEQQLKEEEETLEFITSRKRWMMAITTIYAASAGFAVAEQLAATTANVTAAAGSCAVEVGLQCTGPQAPVCAPPLLITCNLVAQAGVVAAQGASTLDKAKEFGENTCKGVIPYTKSCDAALKAYITFAYGACSYTSPMTGIKALGLGMLVGVAYGQTTKDGGSVQMIASPVISLLTTVVKPLLKIVQASYNFPLNRSITFGAAAVLSGTVMTGLMRRETVAENNVELMKKVIGEFAASSAAANSGLNLDSNKGTGTKNQHDPKMKKNEIKKLVIDKNKSCVAQKGDGLEHSSAACSRPLKLTKPSYGKFNLPAMNSVGSLTNDLTQALVEGDDSKAGNIAGEIGTFAAAVKKESDALKEEYNNYQKKNKKSPVDFNKSIKDQVASLESTVKQTAAENNINLSSLGSPASTASQDEKKPSGNSQITAPSEPPVDPLIDLGAAEEPAGEIPMEDEKVAAPTLDDFESSAEDISKKPEESIFKQLSNRYILNYTKMFEGKKGAEAEALPEKK